MYTSNACVECSYFWWQQFFSYNYYSRPIVRLKTKKEIYQLEKKNKKHTRILMSRINLYRKYGSVGRWNGKLVSTHTYECMPSRADKELLRVNSKCFDLEAWTAFRYELEYTFDNMSANIISLKQHVRRSRWDIRIAPTIYIDNLIVRGFRVYNKRNKNNCQSRRRYIWTFVHSVCVFMRVHIVIINI
jgi:hypothetical protein